MKSTAAKRRSTGSVLFLLAIGWTSLLQAQFGVGTWARTDARANGLTMTVEACCSGGLRLIYHIPAVPGQPPMTLTVDSPMDGTEVPMMVGGKPSGQTMAAKRVDARHYTAVVTMGGKLTSTSNGTLSADGKTLTVETVSPAGATPEKIIETWVRK